MRDFLHVFHRFYVSNRWFVKLVLLVVFIASTNHGLMERLREIGLQAGLVVFFALWLVICISVIAIAFHKNFKFRLAWAVAIGLSAFTGDVFYLVTQNHISADDVSILYHARGDVSQAFGFYQRIFMISAIKTALGFAAILLPPPAIAWPRLQRVISMGAHFIFVPIIVVGAILYSRGGHGSNALPNQVAPLTLAGFVAAYSAFEPVPRPREEVLMTASFRPFTRHIVLVVDESIRADYLEINSQTGLRTHLQENIDKVINYGYASSLTNCSDTTNVGLRYGANRDTENIKYSPAIWSYAHKAGFNTVYIDAQKTGGRLSNQMTEEEKALIDEFIQIDDVALIDRDRMAAVLLSRILTRNQPQFVIVLKSGAHFPYEGKYPISSAVYKPHMAPDDLPTDDDVKLVNSYKNVVAWTVGNFFKELFGKSSLSDTFIIYTADHGQNLDLKNGGRTHCTPEEPHPDEGLVPLMVITDNMTLKEIFRKSVSINFDKTSHFNIFPTLLLAMGYPDSDVRKKYESSLLEPISDKQLFISGYLFKKYGRDLFWNPIPKRAMEVGHR